MEEFKITKKEEQEKVLRDPFSNKKSCIREIHPTKPYYLINMLALVNNKGILLAKI